MENLIANRSDKGSRKGVVNEISKNQLSHGNQSLSHNSSLLAKREEFQKELLKYKKENLKDTIDYLIKLEEQDLIDKNVFSSLVVSLCSNFIESEVSSRLNNITDKFTKFFIKL
jgi:hypothetical protein